MGTESPRTNYLSLLPEGEGGHRPDEGVFCNRFPPLPQGEGIDKLLKDLD